MQNASYSVTHSKWCEMARRDKIGVDGHEKSAQRNIRSHLDIVRQQFMPRFDVSPLLIGGAEAELDDLCRAGANLCH